MTREEVIEELKILKEDYWVDDGYGHETKQYDDTMFALDMAIKALEQEPIIDKIRVEINRQEKWLLQAGYTAYNVDIAFDAIKAVLAESED